MFGFASQLNAQKCAKQQHITLDEVNESEQVAFYEAMKQAFMGTELEPGFNQNWFDEFTPSYCTHAFNCGEKFFLLQSNGEIYSCVRGQGSEPFHYGNIFHDPVPDILAQGQLKIAHQHKQQGMHTDCEQCEYLHLCHTGCPFVKHQQNHGKSYTCALQKTIYRDHAERYAPAENRKAQQAFALDYISDMHGQTLWQRKPEHSLLLPHDLYDDKNMLHNIIADDPLLQSLYDEQSVFLAVDERIYALQSQILKPSRQIIHLDAKQNVQLHIKEDFFKAHCKEWQCNSAFVQILRDTTVVYGDEQRKKQEHLFHYQLFVNSMQPSSWIENAYKVDLTALLAYHQHLFLPGVLNNLFVSTHHLREYHYQKQKNNAFYHIQAINLPFQNMEFYWHQEEPYAAD